MCDVCVNCNMAMAAENCHVCEECLEVNSMHQAENAKYLLELEEYRAKFSDEEWEAMTSLDIDDIPF